MAAKEDPSGLSWEWRHRAKHEIEDVLLRYYRAVDRVDFDLLRTVFFPGAELNYGAFKGTVDDFIEINVADGWLDPQRRLSSTHMLMNHIVDFDEGGEVAWSEAYAVVVSRRRRDGEVLDGIFGGRYIDRFELRDGEWAIARRLVVEEWSRVDPFKETWSSSVPEWAGEEIVRGRRGAESYLDPVYSRI